MKKIPVKKIDSTYIIEYFCEKCDESVTYYPDLCEIEQKSQKIF